MTPLLDALVAASKAGFDAPKCANCKGQGWYAALRDGSRRECDACRTTGLDASDPEKLIGRAMSHLISINLCPIPLSASVVMCAEAQAERLDSVVTAPVEHEEPHDGTPAGLATALLRLVARVGGAA